VNLVAVLRRNSHSASQDKKKKEKKNKEERKRRKKRREKNSCFLSHLPSLLLTRTHGACFRFRFHPVSSSDAFASRFRL
jgi:hypothetical protein